MRAIERIYVGLALLPLALAGCQTPPAVYELAETSSANAAVFQQHLGDLAGASKALAGERADLVVSMEAFNARLDSFVKREIYMRQQSNKPADWSRIEVLMKKLAALRNEIIKIEQAARIAEQSRRKEILGRRTDLDTYATAMREAANALNALAQREGSEERARFIGRFVADVNKDVRAALENSDETSKAAKGLVDKVKGELKDAAASDSKKTDQ
jgi:hypothetical protein